MQAFEYPQSLFVMVLEVGGGEHGHGQDFSIAGAGQAMIAVAQGDQNIVNDDESGYNTSIVHGYPPLQGWG